MFQRFVCFSSEGGNESLSVFWIFHAFQMLNQFIDDTKKNAPAVRNTLAKWPIMAFGWNMYTCTLNAYLKYRHFCERACNCSRRTATELNEPSSAGDHELSNNFVVFFLNISLPAFGLYTCTPSCNNQLADCLLFDLWPQVKPNELKGEEEKKTNPSQNKCVFSSENFFYHQTKRILSIIYFYYNLLFTLANISSQSRPLFNNS
jgi:hypothetical protein